MRELAVQSANDTNVDADRTALQNEVDQLAQELTRISNNTEFNNRTLLNGALQTGNLGEVTFHIGANTGQNVALGITAMDAQSLGVASDDITGTVAGTGDVTEASITGTAAAVNDANVITATTTAVANVAATTGATTVGGALDWEFSGGTNGALLNGAVINFSEGAVAGATWDGTDINVVVDTTDVAVSTATVNGLIAAIGTADGIDFTQVTATAGTNFNATGVVVSETTASFGTGVTGVNAGLSMVFSDSDGNTNSTVSITATDTSVTGTGDFAGVTLTLDGANADTNVNTVTVAVTRATAATFSAGATTDAVATKGVDISTQSAADTSITTINSALTTVSDTRAKLGAYQNRLEHTISNLDTSAENLQASESRIRDVDMAKEMMEFTKNNILQQAAQSMLAQANQAPQGVLQLLR
jgi:flagellin